MVQRLKHLLCADDLAAVKAELSAGAVEVAGALLSRVLLAEPMFQLHARPVRLAAPWFAQAGRPVAGAHGEGADLVAAVFLRAPAEPEAGDLLIDTGWGPEAYREEAGAVLVYPAAATTGVREPSGDAPWIALIPIESQIRDPLHREILYDIARAARFLEIFQKAQGSTAARLRQCEDALLRAWRRP
jgi:PKHD-type hydroxylase